MRSNRIIPKRKKNAIIVWKMRWKKIVKLLPITGLFTMILALFWQLSHLPLLAVKANISTNGEKINQIEVNNIIQPLLILPLNIKLIKNKILQNPWVEKVIIQRKWNTLNINIIEQVIHFNWRAIKNNKQGYINQHNTLFIPKNVTKNNEITILSSEKTSTLAAINLRKYLAILKKNNMLVQRFVKTNIETIILQNGAKIILGQRLQQQRLKKFSKYYHHFKMHENSIVDLRYPNGFAKTN